MKIIELTQQNDQLLGTIMDVALKSQEGGMKIMPLIEALKANFKEVPDHAESVIQDGSAI